MAKDLPGSVPSSHFGRPNFGLAVVLGVALHQLSDLGRVRTSSGNSYPFSQLISPALPSKAWSRSQEILAPSAQSDLCRV
jgi:hypothetical protein